MTDSPTTPNKACRHKQTVHMHGTRACYTLDACRCDDCQAARVRYDRAYKKTVGEFAIEPPRRVDAGPVRAHLLSLMEQGMGPKRMAEVSGVPHGAISKLIYGNYHGRAPSKKVSRANADTLLALALNVADGAKVDATEAKTIVAELVARGWWKTEIGRRVHGPHAKSLQAARSQLVEAGTLRTLRTLLHEPVPLRVHSATGKRYNPATTHEWRHIPETTRGVPSDWYPGSPAWLLDMRAGLKQAVQDSYSRHGRVAA